MRRLCLFLFLGKIYLKRVWTKGCFLYIMFVLDITKEGEYFMNKMTESRMVVHTHTHRQFVRENKQEEYIDCIRHMNLAWVARFMCLFVLRVSMCGGFKGSRPRSSYILFFASHGFAGKSVRRITSSDFKIIYMNSKGYSTKNY